MQPQYRREWYAKLSSPDEELTSLLVNLYW